MHSDIITMMGGKKDMLKMFLPLMVSTVALSLLMPLIGTMMPVSMGSICVYMLFNKEIKYHSEKMPCLLLGDNCVSREYGITDADIIGVMTGYVHNGRKHSVNELGYRIYSHIWVDLAPVRILIRRIRSKLKRIIGG